MSRPKKTIPTYTPEGISDSARVESARARLEPSEQPDLYWKQIETAWSPTDPAMRTEIIASAALFEDLMGAASHATPLSDGLESIVAIKEAVEHLQSVIAFKPGSEARAFAIEKIDEQLAGVSQRAGVDAIELDDCWTLLQRLSEASFLAGRDFPTQAAPGFSETEAWEAFVRRMYAIASARGLPAGARKDSGDTGRTSPFVEALWILQKALITDPRAYRHKTRDGMAKAVSAIISKSVGTDKDMPDHP